jgi:hypothetical protein
MTPATSQARHGALASREYATRRRRRPGRPMAERTGAYLPLTNCVRPERTFRRLTVCGSLKAPDGRHW